MGKVMTGVYEFHENASPQLISGPPETQATFRKLYGVLRDKSVTSEHLQALADVVQARKSGRLSDDQAAQAAGAIKPEFKNIWQGQEASWLAVILAILLFLIQQQSSDRDHAEVMASLQRQYQQDMREYQIEAEQLEELQKIAARMTAAPPSPITEPPPGPRTKRQKRRDQRFKPSPPR